MAMRLYQVGNTKRWFNEGSEPEGAVLIGKKAVEPSDKAKKPANKSKKAVSKK